jgi:hypothetical protein
MKVIIPENSARPRTLMNLTRGIYKCVTLDGYALIVNDEPLKSRKTNNIENVYLVNLSDGEINPPNYNAWKDDQFVPIDSLTFTMK